MRVLSKAEFITEAEQSLRQVFVNDDAFVQPFSSNVVARGIVYPCFQYIELPLTGAIVAAASSLGDTDCYNLRSVGRQAALLYSFFRIL